jgi:hypothetical protein
MTTVVVTNPPICALDPLAEKNWTWDWSSRLPAGVTIAAAQIITDSPLVAGAPQISASGKQVTALMSGSVVGQFLNARCLITMSDGETDVFTLQFEGVNT